MAQIVVNQQPAGPPGAALLQNNDLRVLVYNGLRLSIERTEEWVCEPEMDESRTDYLGYNHYVIGVRCIVNAAATATQTGNGFQGGPPGDRPGVTLWYLQQILMVPRKQLIYQIGNDVVLAAPQAGVFFCDAHNGPKPLALRVIEVLGAKSAVVFFRIEAWAGGRRNDPTNNPIVTSNRWSAQAHVDEDWRTTITVTGRTTVRADTAMNNFGAPAIIDRFRQACLPLPVPGGFKRTNVDVLVTPDGSELQWQCRDEEQYLNIGTDSGIARVEGQVTTGADVGYQDFKDIVKIGARSVGDAAKGQIFESLWNLFENFFPAVRNTFQLRVYGPPNVSGGRQLLVATALQIVLDRFGPQLGGSLTFGNPFSGGLVSLYLTHPIATGHIELRGAVLGTFGAGAAFNPSNFAARMNLGDFGAPLNWSYNTPGPNPNPPNANTSRGGYIGALMEAALKEQVPTPTDDFAVPPSNAQAERGAGSADIGTQFQ